MTEPTPYLVVKAIDRDDAFKLAGYPNNFAMENYLLHIHKGTQDVDIGVMKCPVGIKHRNQVKCSKFGYFFYANVFYYWLVQNACGYERDFHELAQRQGLQTLPFDCQNWGPYKPPPPKD